jgi:transcription termination factor Rho
MRYYQLYDINLIVCLIGERPEEVTDMRRSDKGQVILPPSMSRWRITPVSPN